MAQAYWINKANGKYYLHFKITQKAGSKVSWIIQKDESKSPEAPYNFWDFWEDFNGDSLDTNKWKQDNYSASYSLSNSNFNTWGDSGGCCNGSCYYSSIKSIQTFDLPIRVLLAGNQDPYTSSSNCGKTGPYIQYGSSFQVVTSTDYNSNAESWRIGNNYGTITNSTEIPNISPDYFQLIANFGTDRLTVSHNWWGETFTKIVTPPQTTGQPIGFGGDTDSSSTVDHIGYIAVAKSHNIMPNISIDAQTDYYLKVTVDDSNTGNSEDFADFIVTLELPDNWITDENQGLNITSKEIYLLVENPSDGKIYTWDESQQEWRNLNKTKNQLTKNDFLTDGLMAPFKISKQNLEDLSTNPNFLAYCESGLASADLEVKFTPYNRLVIQKMPFNLKDFTQINKIYADYTKSSWCDSNLIPFPTLISKDNTNWYKWDSQNNKWSFVGTKTLDIQSDIAWVVNNGVDISVYNSLSQSDWETFYNGEYDYLFFAIALQKGCSDDIAYIDSIDANVNIKEYWEDVTDKNEIRFTENTISVKFGMGGKFKINYLD